MEDNNSKLDKSKREEKNNQTAYQRLGVPGSIVIGEHSYTFKEQQKTDKNIFTYRCQKYSCRVPINIDRDNINKIINKNSSDNIEYIIKKEHKCKPKNEKKTKSSINCDIEEEIIKKAKSIIRLNPLKALTYHQNKFHVTIFF